MAMQALEIAIKAGHAEGIVELVREHRGSFNRVCSFREPWTPGAGRS
jgi:hypothetical protein